MAVARPRVSLSLLQHLLLWHPAGATKAHRPRTHDLHLRRPVQRKKDRAHSRSDRLAFSADHRRRCRAAGGGGSRGRPPSAAAARRGCVRPRSKCCSARCAKKLMRCSPRHPFAPEPRTRAHNTHSKYTTARVRTHTQQHVFSVPRPTDRAQARIPHMRTCPPASRSRVAPLPHGLAPSRHHARHPVASRTRTCRTAAQLAPPHAQLTHDASAATPPHAHR